MGREATVRSTWRWLLGAGLAVSLSACAHHVAPASNGPQPDTYVYVDNQGFTDMDIYVISDGQRIRLGTAVGVRKSKFKLPAFLVGGMQQVRFLARPIAGNRSPVSEQITIEPGEDVTLTIPPTSSP
jgi:hypothetical protein